MDDKLTLKLDNQVIEKAKIYARKKNMSLSKLVQSYLEYLTSREVKDEEAVTPLVKSISGVVQSPKTLNYKEDYKKYLNKKYKK